MRSFAIVVACSFLLAGCIYRIDIQQGNYVTQDQVQKLKSGMTRTEARQVLGTPLLMDPFHADRWDYYFHFAKGGKAGDRKVFSVYFKDDKVATFTGDVHPPAPPPVGTPPPPRPQVDAPTPAPTPAAAPAPAKAPPRGPPSSIPR
jgi:outer membrane protein assembly factor BamE